MILSENYKNGSRNFVNDSYFANCKPLLGTFDQVEEWDLEFDFDSSDIHLSIIHVQVFGIKQLSRLHVSRI